MKLVICAGPATTGKTAVLRHLAKKLLAIGDKVAFLKLDVQFAEEDEELKRELGIPTRKVYSGELCPDHCSVMVLADALAWAAKAGANVLLVEPRDCVCAARPTSTTGSVWWSLKPRVE
jgi:Ni2+-binding GTPase involved in maturation of urease and hydrogenase